MVGFSEIQKCRICGNERLKTVLDLGTQALTGVFPRSRDEKILRMPLQLVKCDNEYDTSACGLLQLKHSANLGMMYGDNYGYRSGLNKMMVEHLKSIYEEIIEREVLSQKSLVIDIGSNDGTLLKFYPQNEYTLVGIDPTGKKFKDYYPETVNLIPDFFSANLVKRNFDDRKADVVTSVAMFYDLESPVSFMRDIYEVLSDDGIWVFEQSYMPLMLEQNAYDTVCHEHLEYYALKQIKYMTDKVGFKIIDVVMNDVNGGSFRVTCSKKDSSKHEENASKINEIIKSESDNGLNTIAPFMDFQNRVAKHKIKFLELLHTIKNSGNRVYGYGASTKGNVVLQYCGIGEDELSKIVEINSDKFGAFTPGTGIPIIDDATAKKENPEYLVVLPWHFKKIILSKEKDYLDRGGKIIFPLPEITIVDKDNLNEHASN